MAGELCSRWCGGAMPGPKMGATTALTVVPRNHRPRTARCRFPQATNLRAALVVEGTRHRPEREAAAFVPMTIRLATALREHRHLRAARVVCQSDGSPLSADMVKHLMERVARHANFADDGVHRLRHAFCSHLAMRGAPVRAIQELAGHKDLATTQRTAPEYNGD